MSIGKREFKKAIVDGGNYMLDQGLTVGTWGNLSIRDPETGLIYIKPSGMPYPDISQDDVVVVNKPATSSPRTWSRWTSPSPGPYKPRPKARWARSSSPSGKSAKRA